MQNALAKKFENVSYDLAAMRVRERRRIDRERAEQKRREAEKAEKIAKRSKYIKLSKRAGKTGVSVLLGCGVYAAYSFNLMAYVLALPLVGCCLAYGVWQICSLKFERKEGIK